MKRLITALVFYFIMAMPTIAQSLVSAEIQKNSSLTIKGSTNLVSFKIFQNGDKLCRNKLSLVTTQNQNKIAVSQNQLSVVVKHFDSNNALALKDFLKLLKSDNYPTLQVQLNYLEVQPLSEKGKTYSGEALVNITITGKTRYYSIPITFSSNSDLYTVNGNKKLSIRDFGLSPENKMMGLIKVSEWIHIDFHIICKILSDEDIVKL
jgi:hypothetical protein